MLFTMGLPDKLDLIAEPVISPDVGVGPRSFSELPLIQGAQFPAYLLYRGL